MNVPEEFRLAFVSAPGGSVFMEEILTAVATAASALGTATICHRGFISEVADPGTRFVVVPHEYCVLAPEEAPALYARTVAFGVEHPGTQTFAVAMRVAAKLGARFEISTEALEELKHDGLVAHPFMFGYVESWDRWQQRNVERPIDVVYLGTADQRRLGVIAHVAEDLDDLACELLIPPHEPMTRDRPDFVSGNQKWELLAQSKVMVNLHRENKAGLEWVRCLEAIINGCVVVTEPCSDYGLLVPGTHILVADPKRAGAVAQAIVREEELRQQIAATAYQLCRSEMSMEMSVRRLIEVAASLPPGSVTPASTRPEPVHSTSIAEAPLAVWVPSACECPPTPGPGGARKMDEVDELARTRSSRPAVSTERGSTPQKRHAVDVICVNQLGDGPLGLTRAALADDGDIAALHVAVALRGADEESDYLKIPTSSSSLAQLSVERAQARNVLLRQTDAELICIIDAGDAIRRGALRRLVKLLTDDPTLDIVYAMATYGQGKLVNVLVPERRRLASSHYLTRGFVIRRRALERTGGFIEDPSVNRDIDHEFWRGQVENGASVRLARWIGFALWPRTPGHLPMMSMKVSDRVRVTP